MRRVAKIVGVCFGLAALVACAPTVPDSAPRGPAFGNYQDPAGYRAARDAELTGAPGPTTGGAPLTAAGTVGAATGDAPLSAAGTVGDPTLTAAAEALGANAPAPALNNPAISDEQDFDAVANRETIETDAERLRAQREARQVVRPTAVPQRPSAGPNIVEFALSTTNVVGQQVHRRGAFSNQVQFARNCGRYASPDLAQEAFLQAGGPERDRLKLDPDGDGFACGWNPAPFRRIAGVRG